MNEKNIKLGKYKGIKIPKNITKEKLDKYILSQIMIDSDAEVSLKEIEERAEAMFEQFDIRLSQQGLSINEYFSKNNTNKEELIDVFKEHAKRQIKERKVLFHISKIEGINANEEDYVSHLKDLNKIYPMSVEKMYNLFDDKEKNRIMEEITLRKTIDYIIENCC